MRDLRLLAQDVKINGTGIRGPLKNIDNLGDLVNRITFFVIPLALVVLFLVFMWGGYQLLLSRGDPERIKGGKAKITSGIIGFILLILSYLLVRIIAQTFGLGEGLF